MIPDSGGGDEPAWPGAAGTRVRGPADGRRGALPPRLHPLDDLSQPL